MTATSSIPGFDEEAPGAPSPPSAPDSQSVPGAPDPGAPDEGLPDPPGKADAVATADSAELVASSVRKFQKELSAGIVSLALLALMAHADKPLYGYQISRRMEDSGTSAVALKQGTIYPVLRSLEKKGLLTSELRASESGPARKYYSITAEGRAKLAEWGTTWKRTRDFIDSMVEGGMQVE